MKSNFKSSLFICLSLTAISAVATGCGVIPAQTVTLDTAFDRTGTLRGDGQFTGMLTNNFVIAGDEGNTNQPQRGFISLSLNPIPAGATITQVVLRLEASATEGNPFTDFGAMQVDHVNAVSSITIVNYVGGTLTENIASIPSLPSGLLREVVEIDITTQVQEDLAAGRPISSFRFQFPFLAAPSADGTFDQVFISANQNDITLRPTATVTLGS